MAHFLERSRRWSMHIFVAGALGTAFACVIDAKGRPCGFVGVLADGEGVQYCRDEAAEADCEILNDAIVAAAVLCAGGIDEDTVRADLEGRGGVLENCGNAGATTNELTECTDALADPPCEGTELAKPDVCRGVVLDSIFSDNLPG